MKEDVITLTAPSRPEMEITVSEIASAIAKSMNLSEEQIDEIKMAVIETCLNSFEHSRSEENVVTVSFIPERDRLKITIKDKGIGFNPLEKHSPDIKKIISGEEKRHRGWGLKIIKSLMDEVYIDSDKDGTTVTLIKKKRENKNSGKEEKL
jgi:anti-sigma regulatory factor (Ser/Thr protein kinase)